MVPVGDYTDNKNNPQPRPVIAYLLNSLVQANVYDIHIVIREGKSDIPSYLNSGKEFDANISYHLTKSTSGVPFTINEAYPFIKDKNVLFGFPDILISPLSAFHTLKIGLTELEKTEVLLGLFPVSEQSEWHTVAMDEEFNVKEIRMKKPSIKGIRYAWVMAAWRPVFSSFLNEKIVEFSADRNNINREIQLSEILQMAISEGIRVTGLTFDAGNCLDIGTDKGFLLAKSFVKNNLL